MPDEILSVEVTAGGVLAALAGIEARATDLTPVWDGVADPALRAMFRETWATQGAFIGHPWASLSPTTLALKARRNRANMGTLKDSQRLFRSVTVRSSPDQVKDVRPDGMTFGTRVPYAPSHQTGWLMRRMFGRPVPERFVRARPMLGDDLPPSTRDVILDAMAAYVTDGTLKDGLA